MQLGPAVKINMTMDDINSVPDIYMQQLSYRQLDSPYKKGPMVYHWITMNTIQYHWTIQWSITDFTGTFSGVWTYYIQIPSATRHSNTIQWYFCKRYTRSLSSWVGLCKSCLLPLPGQLGIITTTSPHSTSTSGSTKYITIRLTSAPVKFPARYTYLEQNRPSS